MKQKSTNIKQILASILGLTPLLYLAIKWSDVPNPTPLRFNAEGEVSRYGSPAEFVIAVTVMCIVGVGTYLLVANIHKIDPKRVKEGKSELFDKLALGVLFFITALAMLIIHQTTNPGINLLDIAVLPLIGLLFSFVGNLMYNIKPNYFAGIRVPWTLNDDENWKKTHRLAGGLWFMGGIVIMLSALVTTGMFTFVIIIVSVAIMSIVPMVYSYSIFKKKRKENTIN